MALYDDAGQISRYPFLASVLSLFALCLISIAARFYVRIRVQKQLSIDDGFLIFGICCLISALGVLLPFMDTLYLFEALAYRFPTVQLPPDWKQRTFNMHKMATVALILAWCAIASVKFSFLFLFRKLIDRLPNLMIYWWTVVIFNTVVAVYGAAICVLTCPWYYDDRNLECNQGPYRRIASRYAISQIVLEVIGDLLILYIPIQLIWRIHVKWTQKIALAFSLCLTLVVVIVTITRGAGMHHGAAFDYAWVMYWQIISAEVGLVMTSATAFRTFFIARGGNCNSHSEGRRSSQSNGSGWTSKTRQLLHRLSTQKMRQSRHTSAPAIGDQEGDSELKQLPPIHRGTMTGVRTFINSRGRTSTGASRTMQSRVSEEGDDSSPMSAKIQVQHEISSKSERISDDSSNAQHVREHV